MVSKNLIMDEKGRDLPPEPIPIDVRQEAEHIRERLPFQSQSGQVETDNASCFVLYTYGQFTVTK